MGLGHLEGSNVAPLFVAGTPLRPFPEFFEGTDDMDAQLFTHLHAADVGVEGSDGHLRVETPRGESLHSPPEPANVLAQGLSRALLQPV